MPFKLSPLCVEFRRFYIGLFYRSREYSWWAMAKVNICNVVVKDNPCPFRHPFQFEITFECIENLNEGGVSAYIIYYSVIQCIAVIQFVKCY